MRLHERFDDKGYHSCVMTTFGVDFDIFENAVYSRLMASGCYNNVLIGDQRMFSLALESGFTKPKSAGRKYNVVTVKPRNNKNGVFHPKIILQLGRHGGQLIAGSANMTAPGIAGNLEVIGHLKCGLEASGEQKLISGAWHYLSQFLNNDTLSKYQSSWITRRTPWLLDNERINEPLPLSDGTLAAIWTANEAQGILEKYFAAIEGSSVKRLIIISPYWDEDLSTLRLIQNRTSPQSTILLLNADGGLFPIHNLKSDVLLYDIGQLSSPRFVHAKIILIETEEFDFVLYGSANCTFAALGHGSNSGLNEECCVFRRVKVGQTLENLKLRDFLIDNNPLSRKDISPFYKDESIDLLTANKRDPGKFELNENRLTWWFINSSDIESTKLQAKNALDEDLSFEYLLENLHTDKAIFTVKYESSPTFLRLQYSDNSFSAPAIVTNSSVIQQECMREANTKTTDRILGSVVTDDDESSLLNILEIIDLLDDESSEGQDNENIRKRKQEHEAKDSESDYRNLSYDEFVAYRRNDATSDTAYSHVSSLSGRGHSDVRGYLNRILGLFEKIDPELEEDTESLIRAIQMKEESEDDFDAEPKDYSNFTKQSELKISDEKAIESIIQRRKKEQFADTVELFLEKTRKKSEKLSLNSSDLLRLRAIFMLIASFGWKRSGSTLNKIGNNSWSRAFGKTLHLVFSGKHPAIANLRVEGVHINVPVDFQECWATCMWASQACIIGAENDKENDWLTSALYTLRQQVYHLVRLTTAEMCSENALKVIEGLNKRFAHRLGIDSQHLLTRHLETARSIAGGTHLT